MKLTRNITFLFLSLMMGCATILLEGCATTDMERMPIMVEPYYNSDPLDINVGKFSEKLMSDDPKDILGVAEDIKKEIGDTPLEALYVLAIRLFDLGEKSPAAYWFYNAQYRTKVLQALLKEQGLLDNVKMGDPLFEEMAALNAFTELVGEHINKDLAHDPKEWVDIISQVQKDVQNLDLRALMDDIPGMANKILDEHPEVIQKINEGLNLMQQVINERAQEFINASRRQR